jgi:hypothetical protein
MPATTAEMHAAATVAGAEMHVTTAMTATETHVTAAMTTSTVAASAVAATAAMPAAAFSDCSTRQQGHQNDDGNSDDPFGHGSLLRHLLMFGAGMTPTSEESSTGKAARRPADGAPEDLCTPATKSPADAVAGSGCKPSDQFTA